MALPKNTSPNYKKLTFPQLRSFCEIARHGSMKAAAASMDVSQPTVWKQIYALEKTLGTSLIRSHRRGTELTDAGRLLLEICGPAVNELDSIEQRFAQKHQSQQARLVVSSSPRVCQDDLPDAIKRFRKNSPDVDFRIREMSEDQIVGLVETGGVDIGLTNIGDSKVPEVLSYQLCYHIETTLVVAKKHPLATKRTLRVEDFAKYPLLNARDTFPCKEVNAAMDRVGAFDHPEHACDLIFAGTIRRYAALDIGIGLVGNLPGKPPMPVRGTVEIPLGKLFPMIPIHAVYRKQLVMNEVQQTFIDILQEIEKS